MFLRIVKIVVVVALASSAGCANLKSRYAMSDVVYAEKYAEGAPKGDLVGKAKQALDARHTGELKGLYVSAGTQQSSDGELAGGAEIGFEKYVTSWYTGRIGLAGYFGRDDGYAGIDANIRLQSPTRLAPFVGLGTFHGASKTETLADTDGFDNDDDGRIDELGETDSEIDAWVSSVYPEAGLHWWMNGNVRLTASAKYFITSQGRSSDDWWVGGQLTLFRR